MADGIKHHFNILIHSLQIFVGSNLTKLKKLHLEQNEIWSFRNPNIFCNLPSLMDLQLGDNNLTGYFK